VTWRDGRFGNDEIFIDKISPNGTSAWQTNGLQLSNSIYNKLNPNICSDGNGGAIVAWQDSTINDWDVYSQKINSLGQQQWTIGGQVVSSAIEIQSHPKNIPDGYGGSIYVWQDKRANQYDIYCHHLNAEGIGNSIREVENIGLTVYPNPTNDFLQISALSRVQEIKLYSLLGDLILFESADFGMNARVVLQNLSSGTYILEVNTANGICRENVVKL
jgi:hypothetical protein